MSYGGHETRGEEKPFYEKLPAPTATSNFLSFFGKVGAEILVLQHFATSKCNLDRDRLREFKIIFPMKIQNKAIYLLVPWTDAIFAKQNINVFLKEKKLEDFIFDVGILSIPGLNH